MRIETSLLLSKVGKRIVLLFALCALLPILAIAVGSFYRVARELQGQGERQLKQKSKDHANGIAERLTFLDEELHNLGQAVLDANRSQLALEEDWQRILEGRFLGFALEGPEGAVEQLWGDAVAPPPFDEESSEQLFDLGRSLLVFPQEGEYGTILLARGVLSRGASNEIAPEPSPEALPDTPDDPGAAGETTAGAGVERYVAWGALEPSYLWFGRDGGNRDTLVEEEIQMWVLDPQRKFLYSLTPHPVTVPEPISSSLDQTVPTPAEWSDQGETWISHYFTLSLGFQYLEPHLTVVMSKAKSTMLKPIAHLRYTLLLITLASLWVVLLLSLSQIRKSLIPLERLREGTRRIAERDFSTRVKIKSGDEFEELGDSFNWMVSRLGQQFSTLQALHRIAGAGLGSPDTEALGIGVLENLGTTFAQRARSLTVLDDGSRTKGFTYYSAAGTDERARGTATVLSEEERSLFEGSNRTALTLEGERAEQAFLLPLLEVGERGPFLVLPVHLRGELAAILAVAFRGKPPSDVDSMRQLRQIAEQVGAAIAHVRLFMHVQNLYRGTLKALARTIDAKSKWTLGHSERVTRMAIRLARQLGLSEAEIQVIDRGGQLHDIGKIGVPSALLDKPGALTPDERKKVEAHTIIGERILEPIPGFEDIIPMVGQHHEWFDGGGYPRGLRETEIHWYARILAVADTYDALRSDRPYRGAIVREDVVKYIVSRSGTQFDPRVIEAFVKVVPARAQERAASPVMYL